MRRLHASIAGALALGLVLTGCSDASFLNPSSRGDKDSAKQAGAKHTKRANLSSDAELNGSNGDFAILGLHRTELPLSQNPMVVPPGNWPTVSR